MGRRRGEGEGSWSSNVDFYLEQSSKAQGAGDGRTELGEETASLWRYHMYSGIRLEFLGSNKDLHCLAKPLLLQLCFVSIRDAFKRIDIHMIPQDLLGSCHMLTNHFLAL